MHVQLLQAPPDMLNDLVCASSPADGLDQMCTVLDKCGNSLECWPEVLAFANHVQKRSPRNSSNPSPDELAFGKAPDVSHRFGKGTKGTKAILLRYQSCGQPRQRRAH